MSLVQRQKVSFSAFLLIVSMRRSSAAAHMTVLGQSSYTHLADDDDTPWAMKGQTILYCSCLRSCMQGALHSAGTWQALRNTLNLLAAILRLSQRSMFVRSQSSAVLCQEA